MAWNDIDWANIQTGWQREQRADRAQSEETVQNSVRNSAQIRQEGERRREFDVNAEQNKKEFEARLPLIQEQIKSAQDVNSDKMLFPILMNKLVNEQTTVEEAASVLKTVPARQNLQSMAAQLGWVKARNNADAAMLKDEAEVMTAYPMAKSALEEHKPGSRMRVAELEMWKGKLEGKREAERARLLEGETRVINGQTYVVDKSGVHHLVPKDYSTGAEAIQVRDASGEVVSQVIPKGIGTRIPEIRAAQPTIVQKARVDALEGGLRKLYNDLPEAQADLDEKKQVYAGSKNKDETDTLHRAQSKVDSIKSQITETEKKLNSFDTKATPTAAPVTPKSATPASVPDRTTPSGRRIRYSGSGDVNDPANWTYAQ